jgi:hypothetical protein
MLYLGIDADERPRSLARCLQVETLAVIGHVNGAASRCVRHPPSSARETSPAAQGIGPRSGRCESGRVGGPVAVQDRPVTPRMKASRTLSRASGAAAPFRAVGPAPATDLVDRTGGTRRSMRALRCPELPPPRTPSREGHPPDAGPGRPPAVEAHRLTSPRAAGSLGSGWRWSTMRPAILTGRRRLPAGTPPDGRPALTVRHRDRPRSTDLAASFELF